MKLEGPSPRNPENICILHIPHISGNQIIVLGLHIAADGIGLSLFTFLPRDATQSAVLPQ